MTTTPDPETALISQCDANTRLISVSSVQYASGFHMDINRIGAFCREKGILFCVDAIQSLGALDFDVQQTGADFVVADGHKWMLGPEGVALFYAQPRARDQLKLNQYGWRMVEDRGDFDTLDWRIADNAIRFECGSPNMTGIHALHASLGLILDIGIENIQQSVLKNSRYLIELINHSNQLTLLSADAPQRLSGIISFRINGIDQMQALGALMDQGVICAHRGGGIRFSAHYYNNSADIELAVDKAISLIKLFK